MGAFLPTFTCFMSRIVAIVGRPNVGKSTLFNRLTESRKAIVDDMSGVTRDRHYGMAEWQGHEFTVIDTGGYVHGSEDVFEAAIRSQVEIAIEEAAVLLFMLDVETGITDLDQRFVDVLRRSKKPVLVVANKVDHGKRLPDAAEFYSLGMGEVFSISSATGSGTGELLDELVKHLPGEVEKSTGDLPRLAILGRPNVGKSSLLNVLTGTDRSIVTPIAGTTRDTIDTHYNSYGKELILVDTAGLRKKTKVKEDIEFYSVMRSIRALEQADVVMLMLDATQGIEGQDVNIFHLAERNKKGVVILVNKWDLVEDKETNTGKFFAEAIRKNIAPFQDVPILFISVEEKQRIHKALEVALDVYENKQKRIRTRELNDYLLEVIAQQPPPAYKGKYIRIKYITMLRGASPTFVFFCNLPQYIRDPYKRFLENKIREQFNYSGVPLTLYFREK